MMVPWSCRAGADPVTPTTWSRGAKYWSAYFFAPLVRRETDAPGSNSK